jgi:hypothetical protein
MLSDWIKGPVIFIGYLVVAPLLGLLIGGRQGVRRWILGLMAFITSWHINKLTLMLDSIDTYRGQVRGFEFSWMDLLSIALIVSLRADRTRPALGWPTGAGLYLLYCGLSSLSILHALSPLYAAMAAVKFTKATLIFIAVYWTVREEEDVRFILRAIGFTLAVQALLALQMKYVQHIYQVRGWFEHQNAMAMWAYLFGLPLLASAMARIGKIDARWCVAGFGASAVLVQAALSRAALLFFAAGVVLTVFFSLMEKITARRMIFCGLLGCVGLLGVLASLHTLMTRFHDDGNQESANTRVVMNLAARDMLHETSWGVGWNNFALAINPPYPYGDIIDDAERARGQRVDDSYAKGVVESHYWLLLAETGYLGAGGYFLLMGASLWWCVRGAARYRHSVPGAFCIGLGVALAITYLHSNFERTLTQTKNLYAWLILLAVAAKIYRGQVRLAEDRQPP